MERLNPQIVENKIHPQVRLNAICPYFTMFPLAFPYKVLTKAKPSDIVFDPFCGRGTTNFAARLLGLRSYGVDSNPVAQAIAEAKLINIKPEDVVARCRSILSNQEIVNLPEGEFWNWAYDATILTQICKIREYFRISQSQDSVDIALRAIMLGILHGPKMKTQASYLSNQMPRTFATKPEYSVRYWKTRALRPFPVNLAQLVKNKTSYFFNEQLSPRGHGKIVLGDSREIKNISKKKFDWVVTSPPYYGMVTYEQDQWLRKWFLGGPEKINYSTKSQLKHWSAGSFIADLGRVWNNTAQKCSPGAKMIIRFGAIPSMAMRTPAELIKESLKKADCGWKISTIQKAGKPAEGKRQANQFKNAFAGYIEEIDVFAYLNV